MPKYLTTEVQSCRFIYCGCQLYISIPWGDILDLSESCLESCAARIFAYSTEWHLVIRMGCRPTSRACNSTLHAKLFQTIICFVFLGRVKFYFLIQISTPRALEIETAGFFYSFGNPKDRMTDNFPFALIFVIISLTN